jgi:solute carrier family 26, other
MVGKAVNKYSNIASADKALNHTDAFLHYNQSSYQIKVEYSPIEVATSICFIVGVIQVLMYVLRLGILSFLLSECLVSGFTTGCAVHVFTSQVKDLLGLDIPRIKGYFKVLKVSLKEFKKIQNS